MRSSGRFCHDCGRLCQGLFVEKKGRAGTRGAVAVSSAATLILSKLNETKILSKQTSNLRPEWKEFFFDCCYPNQYEKPRNYFHQSKSSHLLLWFLLENFFSARRMSTSLDGESSNSRDSNKVQQRHNSNLMENRFCRFYKFLGYLV